LAVPKLSDVAAVTAAETWSLADWIALSKSVLLTQEADGDAVGGAVAAGVEVVDDVLEQATRSMNGIATAATQRCIARFSPPEAF
jgi:hypothetical protein